ncbi:endonuclease YncB(thermonuclease family) [Vespertiliibacter pulmonis]|uniref:Endonuclease YncB(Thermonuclease family) n=1 Tax=Vespertiliibacter pulmonis TaxID=1443036 RepID=A0A3N4VV05_9PAST|nr:thermonuclease family protein [Vespertiliibacter pulmonis]RPE83799.1 endonuclease YncB(thermonuclease family) [Vespertiliibacter pulmonis]
MKHKNPIKITFFSILYLFTSFSTANTRQIQCKVVGITDGDTLTCLKQSTQYKVRLLYIDAPESAQPFGNKAKQALAQLAFKKTVTLQITGNDLYHRYLGVLFDEHNQNINLKMVQLGMAWAYKKTQPIYQQAQQAAKLAKIGLWQDQHPIEPAEWRANKRLHSNNSLQKNAPMRPLATDLNCAIKLSCKQMEKLKLPYSQVERYFHQCGWQELDGNRDGIPCNRIYRKAKK